MVAGALGEWIAWATWVALEEGETWLQLAGWEVSTLTRSSFTCYTVNIDMYLCVVTSV